MKIPYLKFKLYALQASCILMCVGQTYALPTAGGKFKKELTEREEREHLARAQDHSDWVKRHRQTMGDPAWLEAHKRERAERDRIDNGGNNCSIQ